jgi:hypothetical protein
VNAQITSIAFGLSTAKHITSEFSHGSKIVLFHDFFSTAEKERVMNATRQFGLLRYLHPTAIVLSRPESSAKLVDEVRAAFFTVWHENAQWLKAKKKHFLSSDMTSACGVLAEMRAYGMLLAAGFEVKPIMKDGPDFLVDQGTVIEVNARQEAAVTLGPNGIAPFGAPDPNKDGDTVGANVISKIRGIKADEHQLSTQYANVLWIDFGYLGLWPGVFDVSEAFPLSSWNGRLSSGGLWHAFYGWTGCPIFECLLDLQPKTRMAHPGRYRTPTRISGSVIITAGNSVLLENPRPSIPLGQSFRTKLLEGLPAFSIERSVVDWSPGSAAAIVNAQANNIAAFDSSSASPTPQF